MSEPSTAQQQQDIKWHETHDNLVGLASWLDSECYAFPDVSNCIRFFEKPWNWDREYDLWLLWQAADSDDVRERCIVAVDESLFAEQVLANLEEE